MKIFLLIILISLSHSLWWFELGEGYKDSIYSRDYVFEVEDCTSFWNGCDAAYFVHNYTYDGTIIYRCKPRWDVEPGDTSYQMSFSTACKSLDLFGLVIWAIFWLLVWLVVIILGLIAFIIIAAIVIIVVAALVMFIGMYGVYYPFKMLQKFYNKVEALEGNTPSESEETEL